MSIDEQVRNRRAIEALRNGVPNRDAVTVLGCNQPEIEDKFRQQLQKIKQAVANGGKNEGLLVAGDFGSGKSHLLEYLMHLALEQNFVCSKVVISKETPLFDPAKFKICRHTFFI
jgi:DNA replication protein DnaC